MLTINKLPLAEEDLIDIWIYGCGKWGAAQADTYLDDLENKLHSLAELPKKYHLNRQFNLKTAVERQKAV